MDYTEQKKTMELIKDNGRPTTEEVFTCGKENTTLSKLRNK